MGKGTYRAVSLDRVEPSRVWESLDARRLVVAIDVAKSDEVAALMGEGGRVLATVKWKHPEESGRFMGLLGELEELGAYVEAVMEPTGTYGDALRSALVEAKIPVFRVSPKRSHDAAEVYDGVPSTHDAKAAAIIGKLHQDGASEVWPLRSEAERSLTALVRTMSRYAVRYQRGVNRLGALLVRHWPELPQQMKVGRATVLELVTTYGDPAAVASDEVGARALMRRVGRAGVTEDTIDRVMTSARTSVGMAAVPEESWALRELAEDTRRAQQALERVRGRIRAQVAQYAPARAMSEAVGKVTAGVLVATIGEPCRYRSASAYLKALGLNLTERSSGQKKGAVHISRRGPPLARRYLWLAALRLLRLDGVTQSWYANKVERDSGVGSKGVMAVMRKLARALWHVARGETFDTTKLFDTSRLQSPIVDSEAGQEGRRSKHC